MTEVLRDLGLAERAVLGSILLTDGKALDDIVLTGAHFADPHLGEMFDKMRAMYVAGGFVDQITFAEANPARAAEVWKLTDANPAAVNAGFYADMVKEAAIRRRVRMAGARIVEWAAERDIAMLTEDSRKELDEAFGVQEQRIRFMSETFLETVDTMTEETRAFPSPWSGLNRALGGFRPGALYVLGARPGVGKTAVGLQVAMEMAKHGRVAFSSLEMSERDLHLRAVSQGATIPLEQLLNAKRMPQSMWGQMAVWKSQTPLEISFDDRSGVSVFDVRTFARSVHRKAVQAGSQLSCVVVDYLQLMTDTRDISRQEKVAEMSRYLKILARDLDVPVIALSQLNRGAEGRQDKRPQMSDLRESGAIEQDADVVVLLHRQTEARADAADDFQMLVAKNRHGETGVVQMRWEGSYVRVVDKWSRGPALPGQPALIEGDGK